jgi:hypothetical protein
MVYLRIKILSLRQRVMRVSRLLCVVVSRITASDYHQNRGNKTLLRNVSPNLAQKMKRTEINI